MPRLTVAFDVGRELLRRRERGPSRVRLALATARMGLKYLVLVRLLRRNPRRERLLGMRVEAGRYTEILLLFLEVFLKQDYAFTPSTPAPRIIDCGGNIGFATLFFKMIAPGARITTVEPSPETFAVLERNIRANSLTNVTSAASRSPGVAARWISSWTPRSRHRPGRACGRSAAGSSSSAWRRCRFPTSSMARSIT